MYSSKLLFLPFSLEKEKNLFTTPLFIEDFFFNALTAGASGCIKQMNSVSH